MYFGGENNGEFTSFFSSAGVPSSVNYGLFSQIANSTPISNTLLEKTLIGGGVGGLIVPANKFKVGDSFFGDFSGVLSSLNNANLTINVKTNTSTILATSGVQTLPATSNDIWTLSLYFTIRKIGGAGTAEILTTGQFYDIKKSNSQQQGFAFTFVDNTTFDTTILNTLDVTAQWGSASSSNSIYSQFFNLNKTY
jgi:hypothetical protein